MENFFDNTIINILILLFIYIILHTAYFFFSILISTKKKHIGIEQKFIAKDLPSNLIIIVYAKNNDKCVINLVNMLEKQNYPKENYQIHVLFDNSHDNSAEVLEKTTKAKIWKIHSGKEMGKDHALSWLLEKLISFRNVNAFVFLDANRIIKTDFLEKINEALFSNDIVVPATEYVCEKGDLIAAVKNANMIYCNRIFNTARAVLKLINPIDSGAVAIKQEVLEIVKCVDFKDKQTEYKYTVFLETKGYKAIFAPDVKTKINYYDDKQLTLKNKISIIKYIFSKIFSGNIELCELITTFFKPSALLVIVLFIGFFTFLYNFEVRNMFFYDIKYVSILALTNIVLFLISLIVTADEKYNPILLALNPVYSILEKIFPNKPNNNTKIKDTEQDEKTIPIGDCTEIIVSDGYNRVKCTVELKNTGEGFKAVFRYKDNTFENESNESYKKALDEISFKLKQNGLKMHICSSCAHFAFKPNSNEKGQNGLCSQKDMMSAGVEKETSLLNSCEYFETIEDLNNIIEFPNNNKQN